MLYEHVGYTIFVYYRILILRITLLRKSKFIYINERENEKRRKESEKKKMKPLSQWAWWRIARPEKLEHRLCSRARSIHGLWCPIGKAPRRRRPFLTGETQTPASSGGTKRSKNLSIFFPTLFSVNIFDNDFQLIFDQFSKYYLRKFRKEFLISSLSNPFRLRNFFEF